ncbi:YopT-type cysteine protease domain-containing protein [Pseudomonas putida]|uniref:YopT-type cysteine protease domain-containing protein n=1 Tax=Pseudomonas putida TaxID=303 RepID=UPI0023640547|nr:YopT-type cysteine protease domain-containing protein [Pseudomonas putida]MDD2055447.1 YopT-type cysteine protease domain-containing protein [Pseudomonas putida]
MSELKAIRVTTKKYGGEVVFKFSQQKGAFKEQLIMHAGTREGACKALCDHWMACHANGLNLFDGLYVNGKKGQFNNAMLASIKQSTIDTFGRGVENQLNASDNWLAKNGLGLVETSVNTAKRTLPLCIIDREHYTAIFFCQRRGGHVAVTYTAGNGEVRFFDPNFGDFKFPTYSAFKSWFEVDFLPLSTYKYEQMITMSYTTSHAFLLQIKAGAHFRGAR